MFSTPRSEEPLVVGILPETRMMLDLYIGQCPQEISGLGEVELHGGQLVAPRIYLLDQEVTSSETVMSAATIARFTGQMHEAGRPLEAFRFWWHSHCHHAAYFSTTDEQTIANFGDTVPWLLSYVANRAGESEARLDIFPTAQNGLPRQITKPVRFENVHDPSTVAAVRDEITQRVTVRVPPKPPAKRPIKVVKATRKVGNRG